ncbi:MAG: hypothetical protein AVDCRST_MAG33-552, partial [uncultured Thermomicrobiales bacterium]
WRPMPVSLARTSAGSGAAGRGPGTRHRTGSTGSRPGPAATWDTGGGVLARRCWRTAQNRPGAVPRPRRPVRGHPLRCRGPGARGPGS